MLTRKESIGYEENKRKCSNCLNSYDSEASGEHVLICNILEAFRDEPGGEIVDYCVEKDATCPNWKYEIVNDNPLLKESHLPEDAQ